VIVFLVVEREPFEETFGFELRLFGQKTIETAMVRPPNLLITLNKIDPANVVTLRKARQGKARQEI